MMVRFAVKSRRPLFEGLVGSEDDRPAFVALADDLEEQVGAALIGGEIANLIQHQ